MCSLRSLHPKYRFNTQPPEGGWDRTRWLKNTLAVSTHSRPKAAGSCVAPVPLPPLCFNTQPPEGGWLALKTKAVGIFMFQHTAARRRLAADCYVGFIQMKFQHIAARRRLGGFGGNVGAAGRVSTHSRPKAAGGCRSAFQVASFMEEFQHTAARRRLVFPPDCQIYQSGVSTHSRPKAAGL